MKKISLLSPALVLSAAGFLGACSGNTPVNIGNTSMIGAQLSDYAASWDGFAETYTFSPDGSDRVRLTLDASGQGTLEIGDAALLPPPTDPNVGYPPSVSSDSDPPTTFLTEGFFYPIHAAQVQSNRVQVGVDPDDIEAAWCALLTPVPFQAATSIADGGTPTITTLYSCLGSIQGSTTGPDGCTLIAPDGTSQPIDCGKYFACTSGACSCSESGCTERSVAIGTPVTQYPVELDAALDDVGTTLTGTLNLQGTRVTVVLAKQ